MSTLKSRITSPKTSDEKKSSRIIYRSSKIRYNSTGGNEKRIPEVRFSMDKSALRHELKKRLVKISPEDRIARSKRICRQVIETDTFRSNRITLREYGLEDKVLEINRAAAALARRVADEGPAPIPRTALHASVFARTRSRCAPTGRRIEAAPLVPCPDPMDRRRPRVLLARRPRWNPFSWPDSSVRARQGLGA